MGLDQFIYARREGSEDIEVCYWRKAYDVQNWVEDNVSGYVSEAMGHMSAPLTMDQIGELYDWVLATMPAEEEKNFFDWRAPTILKLGKVLAGEARWEGFEFFYEASW